MSFHWTTLTAAGAAALTASHATAQNWVNYVDETEARLPAPPNDPALTTDDDAERAYAFGDLDNDGDLDLVITRRPAYQFGARANVLLMNEGESEGHAINGVFIDRTAMYAADSDVPGDQGFLTPTSDRDIVVVDVNDDGWLDVVTAPAWNDGEPKHLSHPRVYRNKGEVDGVWQGLRFENDRIPQLDPVITPRFASVSAGDVTGDGHPDLYFSDFDRSEFPFEDPDRSNDLNNRLLINDGSGHFTDETTDRMTFEMYDSAYGAAGAIADMNDDGVNDIVKQSSNTQPFHIAVIYNDPENVGYFNAFEIEYTIPFSGYYVSVGDLNNNGLLDLVVTDNFTDRFLLNQGPDKNGTSIFVMHQFPTTGLKFGGNSYPADLDNDGFLDVVVTDMDVDVPGCYRATHIYRNNGNPPDVTFSELPTGIPEKMREGTHDAAVMDINGDGWLDLVLGRCESTEIWMNVPPTPPCPADIAGDDQTVNVSDLLALLSAWGPAPDEPADLNDDGVVDVTDLLALLAAWGSCA